MGIITAFRRLLRPGEAAEPFAPRAVPGFEGEFIFRRFVFGPDADAICRFQRETYETNFPGYVVDQAFLIGFRVDLRRAASDHSHALFVVERHHEPIAFLWIVTHENGWTGERSGYINNLYVTASCRGRGLARWLLEQSEVYFRRQSITRIRLEVTESNDAAVNLYRSSGYEVTRFVMELSVNDERTSVPRRFGTGREPQL